MNAEQDDFAAKLLLIEREAKVVLEDLPLGLMRDRLQHIVTIASLLRARLHVASSAIVPQAPPHDGRKDI
jgi:hypothetical protein